MLIVAIPKSASTSLMSTLGSRYQKKYSQVFFRDLRCPSETRVLHKYHSDMREIDFSLAEVFRAKESIYKQHIPPTKCNLGLIKQLNPVILLRDTEAIVDAYFRAEVKGIHPPRPEFSEVKTVQAWRKRALDVGLVEDLNWFRDGWIDASDRHGFLLIDFRELTSTPELTVKRIEKYWSLPAAVDKHPVRLKRERYSRTVFPWILWKKKILRVIRRIT